MEGAGRSRAWGISMAVHAAAGVLMVMALGVGHERRHVADPQPRRMVWVEPVAPRLGTQEAPIESDAASSSVQPAASRPIAPPVPVKAPAPAPPRLASAGRAKPAKPIAAPRKAEPRELDPAPAPPATGDLGGASDGVARGTVGGLGDTPMPLRAVATLPELVERVVPEYPARARKLEVEGQVLLEVVLDRTGKPESGIRVLKSIAMLDEAAVAAVRQWRFRPARDATGQAVRVIMEVPVRFELR